MGGFLDYSIPAGIDRRLKPIGPPKLRPSPGASSLLKKPDQGPTESSGHTPERYQTPDPASYRRPFRFMLPSAYRGKPVDKAEQWMRNKISEFERFGMEDAARNLRHFLDKKGKPQILTRKQARARSYVAKAEKENRSRFEKNFIEQQKGSKIDYPSYLLAMPHRGIRRLPVMDDPEDHEDNYDFERSIYSNLLHGEFNEAFATGSSEVVSTAKDGFVARRIGNQIHIEGTVHHRWDDEYNFEEGQPGAAEAHLLEKHGRAHPYWNKAGWKQRLTGVFEIRNGKLVNPRFHWEDLD